MIEVSLIKNNQERRPTSNDPDITSESFWDSEMLQVVTLNER